MTFLKSPDSLTHSVDGTVLNLAVKDACSFSSAVQKLSSSVLRKCPKNFCCCYRNIYIICDFRYTINSTMIHVHALALDTAFY